MLHLPTLLPAGCAHKAFLHTHACHAKHLKWKQVHASDQAQPQSIHQSPVCSTNRRTSLTTVGFRGVFFKASMPFLTALSSTSQMYATSTFGNFGKAFCKKVSAAVNTHNSKNYFIAGCIAAKDRKIKYGYTGSCKTGIFNKISSFHV
jgi:hypothetical protein